MKILIDARLFENKSIYGYIYNHGEKIKYSVNVKKSISLNRAKLEAVLMAIKDHEFPIEIITDLSYIVDPIKKRWIDKWEKKKFSQVQNSDLWVKLIDFYKQGRFTVTWARNRSIDLMKDFDIILKREFKEPHSLESPIVKITVGSLATVAEGLACSVAAIAPNCGYRLPFFRNDY